ncbi:ribosome biogenesis regulatory protein [Encephalitozoon hellem]|uniref:Ribosome biogenesis regulatory protein n=1 Tax=Encephalitozoon hellem TaxID=27973 RepID=A0A9Q9C772_ENCHE|nr:ribosome biogenesis regulatory protein [Encephalitozoon hellem ATCC 50504]AFM98848.1 ribosome biogenesis regulatory protein [Encephalitozoon hellem ATCC 50504]KAG5860576.1 ribosome biogenesis regulatory protein [Encephalitozoon hellem]UTX43827.1 ribosome biogenesis regulatory protein [Encephalitozoon hellem]WEL39306.1 ribosome biogenesis regulatory protein [Encephalitozoon hellem]|eukprot:XP_003887829.1 ribosome biogenesis regulatory protein [Encephalitozoon hellem ATCC 50504]
MNHLKFLTVISGNAVGDSDINRETSNLLKGIVKEIKACPSTRMGPDLVFSLPEPAIVFPKQHLKEHVETRWERFARAKGIKKKKKGQIVYDEEIGDYVPRYGPHSKKNRILKAAVKEGEVTLSALRRQRKKNIEKNEANRLANILRKKGDV